MSDQARDFVTIKNIDIIEERGAAVLIEVELSQYWIPMSQVEKMSRDPRAKGNDSITMKRWIADKKEIPYE